ncbi:MAG: c-type cytochrome [Agarilytica sp.]
MANYEYEVSDQILDAVGFYSAHLAVPERQQAYDTEVQRGKTLFNDAGCGACHVAQYTTEASAEHPELSEQIIFPYTDLLLHDLGEDLSDFSLGENLENQPAQADVLVEFLANSREWRTPPLWGLGMAKVVDPNASFLHDGRARTVMEEVLWHGGEAELSKQAVLDFSEDERADFMNFLNDL